MKKLEETAALMQSADYKERFAAEYYQLETRYLKLKKMCEDWDAGKLKFTPTCSREVYEVQLTVMRFYLSTLLLRGYVEGIFTDKNLTYKSTLIKVDKAIKKEFDFGSFSFGYYDFNDRDATFEDTVMAIRAREENNKRTYDNAVISLNGKVLNYAILQNKKKEE